MSGIIGVSPDMRSGIVGGNLGDLLDTKTYTWTDGNVTMSDGNGRIVKEFVGPLTLSATNTYVINWSLCLNTWLATSSSLERKSYVAIVMHTSDPGNSGDIFTGGTKFRDANIGRHMAATSVASAYNFAFYSGRHVVAYGTSGSQYFGIIAGAAGTEHRTEMVASTANPMSFVFEEYKGDIDDRST